MSRPAILEAFFKDVENTDFHENDPRRHGAPQIDWSPMLDDVPTHFDQLASYRNPVRTMKVPQNSDDF